ncbi:MAG: hypothetical protein LC798_10900 [Chloroflexi bacterium]|nr:hypothetical protein [Chloroflexota bacterium]
MTTQEPQPTGIRPVRKVNAALIGGAIATVSVWVLALLGVETPAEVAVAIGAICSGGLAYLVPSAESEVAPGPNYPHGIARH